jgi:ADP-heptose:LPS heptosyltransferase
MQIRVKQRIDLYAGYGLTAMLLPLTRLLGILLRRNHSLAKPPRHILFVKLLGLGSLILASDAITAMRRRFPGARFILLTDTTIGDGIEPFGLFDEIIRTPTDRLLPTAGSMIRLLARTWTWRRLWVADLEVYSKLTTVLALLTMACNRFGFHLPPVSFRKYLNTHNIPFDQEALLEANYARMARAMTGEAVVASTPPARRTRERDKPYVLLNNTCSGLADVRKMPDQTFAAVCRWVLDHTVYDIALLGAPGDREAIDRFIRRDPGLLERRRRIVNYSGVPAGFAEYYRFLREDGVCLITIDSGPLHIARALGLPTLSIWGPTDPAHYLRIRPHEDHRHLVHYLAESCSPCVHRHPHPPCGGDNVCMKDISVLAITGKIGMLLAGLAVAQPA